MNSSRRRVLPRCLELRMAACGVAEVATGGARCRRQRRRQGARGRRPRRWALSTRARTRRTAASPWTPSPPQVGGPPERGRACNPCRPPHRRRTPPPLPSRQLSWRSVSAFTQGFRVCRHRAVITASLRISAALRSGAALCARIRCRLGPSRRQHLPNQQLAADLNPFLRSDSDLTEAARFSSVREGVGRLMRQRAETQRGLPDTPASCAPRTPLSHQARPVTAGGRIRVVLP